MWTKHTNETICSSVCCCHQTPQLYWAPKQTPRPREAMKGIHFSDWTVVSTTFSMLDTKF